VAGRYNLPSFLEGKIAQRDYVKWLRRRAAAHVKRDRGRKNESAIGQAYRDAIQKAVTDSQGLDAYTGEELKWSLISKYNNEESKKRGREYKKEFALLPSVDHVGDGRGSADFKICAWRTNDAKNDLNYEEFIELCRRVIEHNERPDNHTLA
jgi:hypothetical protein